MTTESPTRQRRTWPRRVAKLALLLGLVLLLGALALRWRLARGPLSLGFFEPQIESALNGLTDPLTVELDQAVLAYDSWKQPLSLEVRGLTLLSRTGKALVTLDEAGVLVSLPALLHGQLSLVGVDLTGVRVRVHRSKDGRFALGLEDSAAVSSDHPDLADLVDRWLAGDDSTGLQRLRLRGAALEVDDRSLDLRWGAEALELDLRRHDDSKLTATGGADLLIAQTSTPATVSTTYDLAERALTGQISLPQVVPAEIGPRLYGWSGWSALDRRTAVTVGVTTHDGFEPQRAALTVEEKHLSLQADADFGGALDTLWVDLQLQRIDPASFAALDARLGALTELHFPLKGTARLHLDQGAARHLELALRGADPASDPGAVSATLDFVPSTDGEESPRTTRGHVDLERLKPWLLASLAEPLARLEGIRTPLVGTLDFELTGREIERVDFEVQAESGALHLEEVYPQPIALTSATLRGSVSEGSRIWRLEEGRFRLGEQTITTRIDAHRSETGYAIRFHADSSSVPFEQALRYWPPKVSAPSRSWIEENLSAATLGAAQVAIEASLALGDEPSLAVETLDASLPFSGLDLQLLSPETVIGGIDGTARFTLERLDFAVDRAQLRGLSISEATVVLTDLGGDVPLSVDATLSGPIEQVVSVLVEEPLALISSELLAGVTGDLTGKLALTLPLAGDQEIGWEQIDLDASADLKRVSWPQGPLDLDLENGNLHLELAERTIDVRGTVETAGAIAQVEFRQGLETPPTPFEVRVATRIDEQAARALGLPDQDYVSGAIQLEASYRGQAEGSGQLKLHGDLTPLIVTIPEIDWSKSAGQTGALEVDATFDGQGRLSIGGLRLTAADLEATGHAELGGTPLVLERAELSTLRWGKSRLDTTITRELDRDYTVVLGGDNLDLTPVVESMKNRKPAVSEPAGARPSSLEAAGSGNATPGPIAVTVKAALEQVELKRASLQTVLANLRYDSGSLQHFNVVSTVGPKGMIAADLRSVDSAQELDLEVIDAASILHSLQDQAHFTGGNVDLHLRRESPDSTWQGHFEVTDIVLLHLPTVTKILSLASLRGLGEAFRSSGLEVKSFATDLQLGKGEIAMSKALAFGPAFYLTLEGQLNLPEDRVELEGSLAPASTLQRVLGKIPAVKWVLMGRNQQGILATDFTLNGPLEDPEVKVQPFSTLTPGITRDILEAFRPEDKEPP